jgi:hypothetical protein
MNKHTPLPWKSDVWDYSHASPPRKELQIQNKEILIATLQCDFDGNNPYVVTLQEAEANAALIVKAVNCHDELVANCQDAYDYLSDPNNAKLGREDCLAELKAILEKARTA